MNRTIAMIFVICYLIITTISKIKNLNIDSEDMDIYGTVVGNLEQLEKDGEKE
jgi:hypothetical protein